MSKHMQTRLSEAFERMARVHEQQFEAQLDERLSLSDEDMLDDDYEPPLAGLIGNAKHRHRVEALLADDALRRRPRTLLCDGGAWLKEVRDVVVRWNGMQFEHHWQLKPADRCTIRGQELPRYHELYGADYKFPGAPRGGRALSADRFSGLRQLMTWATRDWHRWDADAKQRGLRFDSAVVNWYPSGADYIGEHSDALDDLEPGSPTYVLSYGGSRTFAVKRKADGDKRQFVLSNNRTLIMSYQFNQLYTHRIVKTKRPARRRISVTLRCKKKQ